VRYDGFISYSHAADGLLAPGLQSALHKLAKPWYKARALRVFRDETDLSASPGAWPSIEGALKSSRQFILLASPKAASSKWVRKEIEFWLREHDLDSLVIVLTEGELCWDDAGSRFDLEQTDAIPASLAGAYQAEPLYVDLRFARTQEDLSIANPEFKRRIVPIAAKLHGKTPADLVSEEAREHRRTKRVRNSAIFALTILAVVAVLAAVAAMRQAKEARLQAQKAEHQRRAAEAARDATERELLRAQGAELRAILQRLDVLSGKPGSNADEASRARLRAEREEIVARLQEVTREHQHKLGEAIGFRGDFEFLARFEGHAQSVKFLGFGLYIDPATDLALSKPGVIRNRYTFILTPDELEAVLKVVGLRGEDAKRALEDSPVLKRIRLQQFDVARLVPEVAAPIWDRIIQRFPILLQPSTPPAVQTALLSLGFNVGIGNRIWQGLEKSISEGDWLAVADGIEAMAKQGLHQRFPGLEKRRQAEAGLIRNALGSGR
jgi:hypothetical protein